jgi:N-methylhydantoinase A/oxoprolinase/acetone carboxylase beta subunit
MQHYIAGIDTGGTCTDGVIMDTDTKEVVATAKVSTTHYDLSQGISAVLEKIIKKSAISVDQLVATTISTTLATNSVVEKKGARVGLLVIGYIKHFKLPVTAVLYFKGGHTIQGIEEEPLELEYIVETVEKLKAEVEGSSVINEQRDSFTWSLARHRSGVTMYCPCQRFSGYR